MSPAYRSRARLRPGPEPVCCPTVSHAHHQGEPTPSRRRVFIPALVRSSSAARVLTVHKPTACHLIRTSIWHHGDFMFLNRLPTASAVVLLGTVVMTSAGQAAPLPRQFQPFNVSRLVLDVGDKEKATAMGAIVGGAVGVLLGSNLNQQGPPPAIAYERPSSRVVEDEDPIEEVVEHRPARRIVETEEQLPAPRVVEEEECVSRRTKIYDPGSGETVVRRERECH